MSITAGLFQAVNEAIITAFLFIGFGTILYLTKETDIRKFGGMMIHSPKAALLVLLAGLAMAGVPPLNAFQSKLMLDSIIIKCRNTRIRHNNDTFKYCDIYDIYEGILHHLHET